MDTFALYEKAKIQGKSAEARIFGVLRGGFVLDGVFYANAGSGRGIVFAPLAQVSDLIVREG